MQTNPFRELYSLLLPFTIRNPYQLKLNDQIIFSDICNRYQPEPHSALFLNMKHACDAINYARSIIHHSNTHPDNHLLSFDDYLDVRKRVTRSRGVFDLALFIEEKDFFDNDAMLKILKLFLISR